MSRHFSTLSYLFNLHRSESCIDHKMDPVIWIPREIYTTQVLTGKMSRNEAERIHGQPRGSRFYAMAQDRSGLHRPYQELPRLLKCLFGLRVWIGRLVGTPCPVRGVNWFFTCQQCGTTSFYSLRGGYCKGCGSHYSPADRKLITPEAEGKPKPPKETTIKVPSNAYKPGSIGYILSQKEQQ